jgi:hypothetical protein
MISCNRLWRSVGRCDHKFFFTLVYRCASAPKSQPQSHSTAQRLRRSPQPKSSPLLPFPVVPAQPRPTCNPLTSAERECVCVLGSQLSIKGGPTTSEPTHYATGPRSPTQRLQTTNDICVICFEADVHFLRPMFRSQLITLSRNAKWAKPLLTSPTSVAPTTLTSTYACDCARAARAKGLSRYQWQRNTRNTKGSLPVPKAFRKLLCPKP